MGHPPQLQFVSGPFFIAADKDRRKLKIFGGPWWAQLHSRQWSAKLELSGRQRKNRCGARVSVGLHKFSTIYRKLPEPLRCNGSGHFANSRQIVVSNPRPIKQSPLHPLHAHTNIPEQCRSPRRSRLQCHGQYKRSETPPHLPMGQMPAF